MDTYDAILSSANAKFCKVVKKPEKFLQTEDQLFQDIKLLSKVLYDVGKITESQVPDKEGLPELIINNFDEEQVWAGIDLHNKTSLDTWRRKIKKLKLDDNSSIYLKSKQAEESSMNVLDPPLGDDRYCRSDEIESQVNSEEEGDGKSEEGESEEDLDKDEDDDDDFMNDPDFQNMSDSEGDDLPLFENLSEDEKSDDEAEGTYRAKEKRMAREKTEKESRDKPSEVDDNFFKLRDMEKFLEIEDRREEGKPPADDDNNEDIDYFEDIDDEDDTTVMYAQYFKDEKEEANLSTENKSKKKLEIAEDEGDVEDDQNDDENASEDDQMEDEEQDEMEMDESEDANLGSMEGKANLFSGDSDSDNEVMEPQSTHEKSQERLKNKILRLEETAVGEKPWQLGGEVAAPVRPENSLLAEDLDYESGVRPVPVMTEAVARKLEDIILQRIKDQAWDDVERKVKPVESAQEYKKKLVLDQEKSKLSLAQVYEEEYLRISQAQEKQVQVPGLLDKDTDTLPLEVKRIKDDMRSLFAKLDTLTHNHYTPKQKSTELKIVRNVASIQMEEVAPVGASNATLLAPAEVVDKTKGELMTDADKTKTDRKRERRQKKAKIRAKLQEKARKDKLPEGASKQSTKKYIEVAEKQGKLKTVKEKDKNSALKSSTAFFNVLQDEVRSNLKDSDHKNKKKKSEKKISLSSLRL